MIIHHLSNIVNGARSDSKSKCNLSKGLKVWTDLSRTLKIFGAKVLKGFLKPFKKRWLISSVYLIQSLPRDDNLFIAVVMDNS